MADLNELIEAFQAENHHHSYENEEGVRNFCRLLNAMGYRDPQYFGQFAGASYGDLIRFLEDNPGAMEVLVEWIAEQNFPEWKRELESHLREPVEE